MSLWLGVDPGFTGAFVAVSKDGIVHCFDMPIYQERFGKKGRDQICRPSLRDELLVLQHEHGKIRIAVIEDVNVMPHQGSASSGRFMKGYGMVLGVISALCIPEELVKPRKWKQYMGLDDDKKASLALARAKWPTSDLFSRVKDNGRAEAALLAEYGRRIGL